MTTDITELAQLRAELSNPAVGSKDHLRKLALSLVEALEKAQDSGSIFQQSFFRQSLMYDVVAEAYEEAKEQIAKDVEIKARLCLESNSLFDRLRAAEKRIAEINKRNTELTAKIEPMDRRIAELEVRAFNPAILDVIAERQRQQSVEGWTPEHDDEHCNGELAMAAVCYMNETGTVNRNGGKPWGWPWDASWWKSGSRRRNLVKAGALILAEIERIDRAAGIGVKGE
ncbi:TPA: hypothetical protein ACPE3U_001199 [Citrobacter freundii]